MFFQEPKKNTWNSPFTIFRNNKPFQHCFRTCSFQNSDTVFLHCQYTQVEAVCKAAQRIHETHPQPTEWTFGCWNEPILCIVLQDVAKSAFYISDI